MDWKGRSSTDLLTIMTILCRELHLPYKTSSESIITFIKITEYKIFIPAM